MVAGESQRANRHICRGLSGASKVSEPDALREPCERKDPAVDVCTKLNTSGWGRH